MAETQTTLLAEVDRIIQDDSYTEAIQLSFLNQAMQDVAGLVLLPDLETSSAVTTSTTLSYVAMPSDYQRNLFDCYNSTRSWHVEIKGSFRLLTRMFQQLDQAGSIQGVAVRGTNLHYQRIPSTAESLTLYYYRPPVDMASGATEPDGIPQHLARPLLVHGACKGIYGEIEEDIKGNKVNTLYHETEYTKALGKLIAFVGPENRAPIEIQDELGLESYL